MAKEIERKFLIKPNLWKPICQGNLICQGYLLSSDTKVVRVRTYGDEAYLTIKGPTIGISRDEFEYEIPIDDAELILTNLCEKPILKKTRFEELYEGRVWEIDVFHQENEGLIVAEVELEDEKAEIIFPNWIDTEISGDPKYFNNNLIKHPYRKW